MPMARARRGTACIIWARLPGRSRGRCPHPSWLRSSNALVCISTVINRRFSSLTRVVMASANNRQILLKSRPNGRPSADNFELVERPAPEPGDGQVLLRTLYLSLDPYMRGRMNDAKSYAKPAELGQPMVGGTVSELVASRNAKFAVGDIVLAYAGWQDYALSDGGGLRKLDAKAAPLSTALGI